MTARALLTLALLLTLAACGGTSAVPVQTLVQRDTAICRSYAQRVERVPPPAFQPAEATRARLPEAFRYLDRVVPLLEAERTELAKAGRPAGQQNLYHDVTQAFAAVVHDARAARDAAHAGRLDVFRNAVRAQQADGTRLTGLVQQFGLVGCVGV